MNKPSEARTSAGRNEHSLLEVLEKAGVDVKRLEPCPVCGSRNITWRTGCKGLTHQIETIGYCHECGATIT